MQVTCPYCWQTIPIEELPRSEEGIELVTDCEVCCRPIRVRARWESGDSEAEIEVETES